MPSVTITLTDTPTGGVSLKTDFSPAAGLPCSAAQAAALDIISRTRRDYGLDAKHVAGADIDAVHHRRANRDEGSITYSSDARQ